MLISTEPHKKASDHVQANHRIKFKGSNKLCHKFNKITSKIRGNKQIRIMRGDMEEQIGNILYAILASKEAIMPKNVHTRICIMKVCQMMMNPMMNT